MRGRRDEAESLGIGENLGIGGGLMGPPPPPPTTPRVGRDTEEDP